MTLPRIGALFSYDWDTQGFNRSLARYGFDEAGFNLFTFPDNAHLISFDLDRFARRQAARGRRLAWRGVVSHHEQFGALAAALVAERLSLRAPSVESVLAAQHKLHARRVLQRVAPEANIGFADLDAAYGGEIPAKLRYPTFVKPVKAAFSVLAREVANRDELVAHTRFGWRELWVIRRLVEPFERICRARLPEAGTAHRMLLEEPVPMETPQYNLDGWVHEGQMHLLGVVDAVMAPGTQAFMRWELPSRLPMPVQQRALDVARRFLAAIGFDNGFFNFEFFFDAAADRLAVIEFNPRLASQFSDLYLRVLGIDPHAMSIALAMGDDPLALPRVAPTGGAAASFVYRAFPGDAAPPMPDARLQAEFTRCFPDALLYAHPRSGHALARDFKWLGNWRYGIMHLHGRDERHLRERCERASALLGWTPPYADCQRGGATAQRWQQDLLNLQGVSR